MYVVSIIKGDAYLEHERVVVDNDKEIDDEIVCVVKERRSLSLFSVIENERYPFHLPEWMTLTGLLPQ
jgi:hypothetical protein